MYDIDGVDHIVSFLSACMMYIRRGQYIAFAGNDQNTKLKSSNVVHGTRGSSLLSIVQLLWHIA